MAPKGATQEKGVSVEAPVETAPEAPVQERPFPEPEPVEKPVTGEKTQHAQTVDDMAERFEAKREEELQEAIAADPGLAAKQAAIEAEQAAANKAPEKEPTEQAGELVDGAASRESMHEPVVPETPALPVELQDDPLAEYIVMVDGRPQMRLKVDGKDRFLDLERARATVQKHESADTRLQQAAAWNVELQQREAVVLQSEETLRARAAQPVPSSEVTDVGDAELDLDVRSRDIITEIMSGTDEGATEKLSNLLKDMRQGMRSSVPQADPNVIGRQAVAVARQELQAAAYQEDLEEGREDFKKVYPDIMADKNQFLHADFLTDLIKEEHPDWSPGKVMMESGERTREWVKNLSAPSELPPPPEDVSRQAQKARLRRVPQPTTARREPESEERPETPQEIVAKMRAARNQPT